MGVGEQRNNSENEITKFAIVNPIININANF